VNLKLIQLQNKYKKLICRPFEFDVSDSGTEIRFIFELDSNLKFCTKYAFKNLKLNIDSITEKLFNYLTIIESFSYWKLACPANISFDNFSLTEFEESFFKKLLMNGRSEFFYRNNIYPLPDVNFIYSSLGIANKSVKFDSALNGSLVLVGGGKDSIVSLELLRKLNTSSRHLPIVPFSINPIKASIDSIEVSEFQNAIICHRQIDNNIIALNKSGQYLNGHIPFSSVLAMISTIVAHNLNLHSVITSNESSSNEGNVSVDGINVNHQYSKSFEFEKDFSSLLKYSKIPITYFSLLRPLNEIQIAKIFSEKNKYHKIFQSCNIKQTMLARETLKANINLKPSDRWCANCPKCVFVYLMLNLFLPKERLIEIFGVSVEDSSNFKKYCEELAGLSEVKPFECVGTFEEVRVALSKVKFESDFVDDEVRTFLKFWDSENNLDTDCVALLKKELNSTF